VASLPMFVTSFIANLEFTVKINYYIYKTLYKQSNVNKLLILTLQAWMDQYFSRIKQFSGIPELPSRIRFMLQDVIELRENKVSVCIQYI
jgi:hypothetical protein